MKISLEIPTPVAQKFKAVVPSSERSAVVTRLLERAFTPARDTTRKSAAA